MSDYTCCDRKQGTPYCGYCGERKEFVSFSIGYLSDNVNDWNHFCVDIGLNSWCLNEGLADRDTKYPVEVGVLGKHGILPGGEK